MQVSFTVFGKVMGKPRPKVTLRGGKHAYTPKSYRGYEERIAKAYLEATEKRFKGPVWVRVDVYRALPKSRPKSVESEFDVFKPDMDNILKACLDALNGVAYDDDNQVVQAIIVKHRRKRIEEHMDIRIGDL